MDVWMDNMDNMYNTYNIYNIYIYRVYIYARRTFSWRLHQTAGWSRRKDHLTT